MTGGTYDFNQASIFSVVLAVLVLAISAAIPNEPVEQH
ncbi:hypothetical protein bthur0004_10690 [Bacillus thuringiensis serovar sotto str. T04001]|nr:hypothetical protein bthur0004_10690 [Bacillus thuringiensis serovar sotto str. T04001]